MAGTPTKFDPYGLGSQVIGMVAGNLINSNTQKGQEKRNEALQKELQGLNESKIKDLEKKLLSATSELEREKVFVEYLSEQKGMGLLENVNKNKYIMFTGVGIGIIVLTLLLYKISNRNGQRN
jgi:hypothetical protein